MGRPLFAAAAASPKRPEIGFVQVRRREGRTWKRAPETFPASDLPDREALAARFGGGEYELVARCSRNHRITSRARVSIPGDPKPLGDQEDTAEASSAKRVRPGRRAYPTHMLALLEHGRLQSRVFRMFERGCNVSEIVRATKLPVEEVRRLWSERDGPLETSADRELAHETRRMEGEYAQMEERRLTQAKLELERRRTDLLHEREKKRLELVERVLKLRERELDLARSLGTEPPANTAAGHVLESLVSMLTQAAR